MPHLSFHAQFWEMLGRDDSFGGRHMNNGQCKDPTKTEFLPVIAVNCCINPFTPEADASPSAAILPPLTTTQMTRVRIAVPYSRFLPGCLRHLKDSRWIVGFVFVCLRFVCNYLDGSCVRDGGQRSAVCDR